MRKLLKARVASWRSAKRKQLQLAIAEVARTADGNGKLFEGKIFVAELRTGNFHRALNKMRAIARCGSDLTLVAILISVRPVSSLLQRLGQSADRRATDPTTDVNEAAHTKSDCRAAEVLPIA
jgi:hypothetical protein